MWALLGSRFLGFVGGTALILVLLIILVSVMGGMSYHYDTSDRSWGGWNFTINLHPGKIAESIQKKIEGRKLDDDRKPLLNPNLKDPRDRPRILPGKSGDPGISKLPRIDGGK